MTLPLDLTGRFWPKVDKQGGVDACWLWIGAIRGTYGVVWLNRRNEPAHRVSWAMVNGEVPRGLFVLHRCDVRRCVNPAHLFLGRHEDNMRDMSLKGRGARGSKAANAKLTEDDVAAIKRSGKTLKALGEQYGVHLSNIHLIKTGKHWAHVK